MRNYLAPELRDRLLAALAEGTVEDVAKRLGVTPHTAYAWDSRRLRGICVCGQAIHPGPCGGVQRTDVMLRQRLILDRENHQLTTHELAAKYSLPLAVVQHAVRRHPLKKRRKIFDPTHWTATETQTLAQLYPLAPWAEIGAALPGRRKLGIERKACELKIRRRVKERIDTSGLSPTIADFRRRRLAAKLSHRLVAEEAQINLNSLRCYETGRVKNIPRDRMARWADALDRLEPHQQPSPAPASSSASQQPQPSPPRPRTTAPPPPRARSIFDLPHTPKPQQTWRRLDIFS